MISNRYRITILMAAFILIIAFPILNEMFGFVKDIESVENRKMAARPEIKYTYLDPFPGQYEKYYNDNFTIRSIMVREYNELNIKLFSKSPLPEKIIIGKDKWLFMAEKEIKSYQGLDPLTADELEMFKKEMEYRVEYLKERNCRFYFMIAPVKAKIYPEYMPSTVYQVNKQSWGEQLNEYLQKNSTCKPVDIYNVLLANKDKDLVYYKLDNHWNQMGAFYCANEFFDRLRQDFPGITEMSLDDFSVTKTEVTNGNIVKMISNTGNYKDISYNIEPKSGFQAKDVKPVGYPVVKGFPYPNEYEMDKEIAGSDLPKILIISDSFGGNIFPFISEKFRRTVKIFDSWQYKLNEDIVEHEKPDVVLLIVVESGLRNILEHGSDTTIHYLK